MSRKHKAQVREVLPDSRYQDVVVTKFVNCLMKDGKKSTAERAFYSALNIVEEKTGEEPLKVFKTNRGITDTSAQTISIHTNSTLEDLSKSMNKPLDQRCFRGNIWLNEEAAWSEFDWIGKVIRIGTAELEIIEPIERCMATTLDPETAISNADTLNTLNTVYGHQNFGVFGIVSKSGYIKINDKAELV